MNSNFRRLIIPSKFSNHRSLFYFSRRTCRLRKEYGVRDKFQNDPLDMIEVRLNRLKNMRKNKETLPNQSLTILTLLAMLMKTKNRGILKTLTKIQLKIRLEGG